MYDAKLFPEGDRGRRKKLKNEEFGNLTIQQLLKELI